MFTNIRKVIFRGIGIIIFILIAIFSYYQYRSYVNGPEIVQINLQDHTETEEPSFIINANVLNTKFITINDKEIALKDNNIINEIVVFSPGNNIIILELEDAFGKTRSYTYNIYYSANHTDYSSLQELKKQKRNDEENLITNTNQ